MWFRSRVEQSMMRILISPFVPRVQEAIFSFITARNEVGARWCFYTCLYFCSQGGVCPIACWDTTPTHPRTRGRHPPGADPLGPESGTPQTRGRHPPPEHTPQVQCMLGDKGNKRAVRILLGCNLVLQYISWHAVLYLMIVFWEIDLIKSLSDS